MRTVQRADNIYGIDMNEHILYSWSHDMIRFAVKEGTFIIFFSFIFLSLKIYFLSFRLKLFVAHRNKNPYVRYGKWWQILESWKF